MIAEFRWKNRELAKLKFAPFDYLPERIVVISAPVDKMPKELDKWTLWFSKLLKPAALHLIEQDIRIAVEILWHFDLDSAKAIERILKQLYPASYYTYLD